METPRLHDDGEAASASASARPSQQQQQRRPKQRPSLPPPAPSLIPIDNLLDAAAAALPFGGLLHGPLFSLHDAMLAVEVGDPKLDAGARQQQQLAPMSTTASVASAASASPSTSSSSASSLSETDAVAALDGLAAAEAAWLAGGCLGTTVLTCLFMLRPRSLLLLSEGGGGGGGRGSGSGGGDEQLDPDLITLSLRAVAAATRAAVAAARALVTRAGVCEDEDFQLFQQAMPQVPLPLPRVGGEKKGGCSGGDDEHKGEAEQLLDEAEGKLLLLARKGSSSSCVAASLALRMRFRRATLRALRAAERAAATEPSSAALAAAVTDALAALDEIGKEESVSSSSSAAAVTSTSSSQQQQNLPLDAIPGFDSAAARSELPPAPPRPDRAFGVAEGHRSWRGLLSDLAAVASFPESVAAEEEGGEEEEGTGKRRNRRRWHLRGALRAVRAFALRGAGAVPRSALALVLGLALDAAANAAASGSGKSSDHGDGESANADGSSSPPPPLSLPDDNPYVSEASVRDALHLPQDLSMPPFSSCSGGDGGGGGGGGQGSPDSPPHSSMAAKFVEQAVLGLQGWCVAALLNRARSRRRHRRCLEDWAHVHQHALNAENDELFVSWLEGGDGWDWRLPASASTSSSAGEGSDGGDNDGNVPAPRPLSPADAAIVDHASPLSCWVEEQACRAERDHLLSGFALELYAPHESAQVLLCAEHLERRAEGAAGALAERYPRPRGWSSSSNSGEEEGEEEAAAEEKKGKAGAKQTPPPLPPRHRNGLAAEADSRAAAARRYVAGALLRASAALMADSVSLAGPTSKGRKGSKGDGEEKEFPVLSLCAPRVPPAPEPFNAARDRWAARFCSGPLARLTTPPRLTHEEYECAVGDPLRVVAENCSRRRFGGDGGGEESGGRGLLSCLSLLRLAKDACLLARRALPQLAELPLSATAVTAAELASTLPRALSREEEQALSRVLGMTAVSLGVLEKEELEAEERRRKAAAEQKKKRRNKAVPEPPSSSPLPLVVSWDCSVHALYPALRVSRGKKV